MLLNGLKRSLSARLRGVPLSFVLVVPFLLQVSLAVGVTAWLVHREGRQAVQEVAGQLHTEVTTRVSERLEAYLKTSYLINQINADALRLGIIKLDQPQVIERYLGQQLQEFQLSNQIFISNPQGGLILAGRQDTAQSIKLTNRVTTGHDKTNATQQPRDRQPVLKAIPNFDARTRPWYKAAVQAGKPVWSEIYKPLALQEWVIAASQPVYDDRGKLLAVVANSFKLSDISQYLNQVKIGKAGQTFIIERSGLLVATSTEENPVVVNSNGQQLKRVSVTASQNALVRSAAAYLKQRFGSFAQINGNQQLVFDWQGRPQLLQVTPLKDAQGIDWLVVVVVPEADFTAAIHADTSRNTVLLYLVAFGLTLVIGIFTTQWIAHPIRRLSQASRKLSQQATSTDFARSDSGLTVTVQGIDELEVLAQSFNQMSQQLHQSFVALATTNEALELRVEQRTQELQQEIQERIEAEEALKASEADLRSSEERWQLAVHGSNDGIWDWNLRNNTIFLSTRWKEMLGYDELDIPNQVDEYKRRIHPDDVDRVMQAYNEHLARQVPYYIIEFRMRCKDGSYKWILSRGQALWDEAGTPIRMAGSHTDITDRKRAEVALREAEEKYRGIFENAVTGIFQTTPDGRYLSANPALARIYGYESPEDLIANLTNLQDQLYVDPQRRAEFIALMEQQNHVWKFECQVYRRDGSIIWISENALAVRDEGGRLLYYEGTVEDITDRKRAEEELARARDSAESANRAKSAFLANMSHELRTPLNAILGLAEALQDEVIGSLNPEQHASLNTLEKSGKHLLELINDILDLAKVESGKMEIQPAPTSIQGLCDSSLTFVRQQAFKKNIQLSSRIPEGLEPIQVDKRRIRQVLINLLSNAVKFTPEGGRVWIEVEPEPAKTLIHLSVVDTGIGITPDDLSKLFQPFVQIDSSYTRRYTGTGLGLALVQRVVELHGGTVTVKSQPGQGSRFTVTLPWQAARGSAEIDDTIAPPPLAPPHNRTNSPLILLAEDNQANVLPITQYLGAQGYRIVLAKNGVEAVEAAKTQKPDLILMDVQMPEMDGLEATRQIRADAEIAHTPIVALTAFAMTSDREQCLAAGMDECMTKPVQLKELVRTLTRYLTEKLTENKSVNEPH